jgi:UPF0176 protein
MTCVVATFYKFVQLPEFAEQQQSILQLCAAHHLKGTILLAPEGINGALWGLQASIEAVVNGLRSQPCFADLEVRMATSDASPFDRMKVRLKQEIVTLGHPEADPSRQVGIYVDPEDWNALIADPAVTVIDTRNAYEVSIGTFKGAINPETTSFRQFPNYVQEQLDPKHCRKVALFCTGGIRCEKATALMLSQGFQEVYHLKGGILSYLETVPEPESLWQGECFVFDQRVTVRHGLELGNYDLCSNCGYPISEVDQASPAFEPEISCPHCVDQLTPERRSRRLERQRQLNRNSELGKPTD